MIDYKVKNFWTEFEVISNEIIKYPESIYLIQKLDHLVDDLGPYSWEYGPSVSREYYFSLSPNLNEELLNELDKIILLAPQIKGWEFFSGKPKKNELLTEFTIENEAKIEIKIDTTSWECIIYKFQDGKYELDVKIFEIAGDEDTAYSALDVHLVNLLGERCYIKKISGVSLISEFDQKVKGRAILLNNICKYISC